MAKYRRHRLRRTSEQAEQDRFASDLARDEGDPFVAEPSPGEDDWFGPAELDDAGEEIYAARTDVSLASMLMLGTTAYQRMDGMGLARKALEEPPTGDARKDLSDDERVLLANARAWCLLVHGDLGHRARLDDPFVLADAERHVDIARTISPGNPHTRTTVALLQLRQGRTEEALTTAREAVDAFAALPDHQRGTGTLGGAILALMTLALAAASSGDSATARSLVLAARAVRTSLEVDEAAFTALMTQLDGVLAGIS